MTPGTLGRVVPDDGRVGRVGGGFVVVVVVVDVDELAAGAEVELDEERATVVDVADGVLSLCVDEVAGDPQEAAATPRVTTITIVANFPDIGPLVLKGGGQ